MNAIFCRLANVICFAVLLTSSVACTGMPPLRESTIPTVVVAISSQKAIALATEACRIPHLVLVGEPTAAKATLMTLAEADETIRTSGEQTSYPIPMNAKVWLALIDGQFQLIGGPPPAAGVQPTSPPPWVGVCQVIVDADTGAALVVRNRPAK